MHAATDDNAHDMCDAVLADEIAALVVEERRIHARLLSVLEVFDRRGLATTAGYASTAAWLRATHRLDPGEARRHVSLARDLADALPLTRDALAGGSISPRHAQVIASLRTCIDDDALAAAEPHLVDAATGHTAAELRGWATQVREAYGPSRLASDEAKHYDQRRLSAATTFQGVGVGSWLLHPAGQETVLTALHALAAPCSGDDRSSPQRMADALVEMAEIAMRARMLPQTGGATAQVTVAVHVTAADMVSEGRGLGAAEFGFGAVCGSNWARRMSCDAEIARVVFGPAGQILDSGRRGRVFSPAQRRAIVARDGGCIWPGCGLPAAWCDAHHIRHWSEGGPTAVDNAALLCGRHHDRVHAHGHAIHARPDGRPTVDLRRGSDPRNPRHSRHSLRPPPAGP